MSDMRPLSETIEAQARECLAAAEPKLMEAMQVALREYLLGDPDRAAGDFRYPVTIRAVVRPGCKPASVETELVFRGAKYTARAQKPGFVQLDLFEQGGLRERVRQARAV